MSIAAPLVHIVDDEHGMRESLQTVLGSAGLECRVYGSAEEFLENLDLSRPGCIILDMNLPGMDGVALLQQLRLSHQTIPVIVVSGYADVSAAVRSMKMGAADVLQKPFDRSELLAAVNKAIGESEAIEERRKNIETTRSRFEALTGREQELLKLVISGDSNKQIALKLSISIKTVANHRAHLMAKMLARNAADLALMCSLAGILPEREVTHTG
jgi:FixJ family two-component response regulator